MALLLWLPDTGAISSFQKLTEFVAVTGRLHGLLPLRSKVFGRDTKPKTTPRPRRSGCISFKPKGMGSNLLTVVIRTFRLIPFATF